MGRPLTDQERDRLILETALETKTTILFLIAQLPGADLVPEMITVKKHLQEGQAKLLDLSKEVFGDDASATLPTAWDRLNDEQG